MIRVVDVFIVIVEPKVLAVETIPVVVRFTNGVVVSRPYDEVQLWKYQNTISSFHLTLVVTGGVVGGVVVVDVVLDSCGSQILKTQKWGSVIGADSAPFSRRYPIDKIYSITTSILTTKVCTTWCTWMTKEKIIPLRVRVRLNTHHCRMWHSTDDQESTDMVHKWWWYYQNK